MRIVVAGETYYPFSNGQAVFTTHLAEGLASVGHDVMAIVPSERGEPYTAWTNGVRVEAVRAMRLMLDVYVALPAGRRIAQLLAEFRPDVVHIQDHYPMCSAVVTGARRRGVPVMGTNHFLPENIIHYLKLPRWTWPALERLAWWHMLLTFNRLDLITAPSATAAAILRRQHPWPRVEPISNGIDQSIFCPDPSLDRAAMRQRYGLDPNCVVFLFVGRVDQEKRLDVLLQALTMLEHDGVQVAIAGRGRYSAVLKRLARELNLGNRAVFTGYVPPEDLPGLLNSVDIFVMPSEAELQSIATLEAMASAKPVLAANARALPELVEPGTNGYLFKPGDAADAARCMARLVDERGLWSAMGAASLARVAAHSLSTTVLRYAELYERLARSPLPAASRSTRRRTEDHSPAHP